jgi:aspartate kinase
MKAFALESLPSCTILKFGGSSVGSHVRIQAVAQIIRRHFEASNRRLVVVVSAMGDTTDDLIELAQRVSPNASTLGYRREMDMLLSTGERVSMALLSMALADLGLQAVSFTGSQSGIITTSAHGEARISEIRPIRLLETLEKKKIAIVAGFQGVSPEKEITTLGRGGSDTSAVALGAALHADAVHIYTDVDGVYTADPRKVPGARRIPRLSWEQAYLAASRGAQVLHARCLEVAQKHRIPVQVLSSFIDNPVGTWIDAGEERTRMNNNLEDPKILTLSFQKGLVRARATSDALAAAVLQATLQERRLKYLGFKFSADAVELLVESTRWSDFASLLPSAEVQQDVARLSIMGTGLTVASALHETLTQQIKSLELKILSIDVSESCVEILAPLQQGLDALTRALHARFLEDATKN